MASQTPDLFCPTFLDSLSHESLVLRYFQVKALHDVKTYCSLCVLRLAISLRKLSRFPEICLNGSKFKIENNILKGPEVSYAIDHTSLSQFVLDSLEGMPDFVGQVDAISGEEYTYAEMRERSVRYALWMRSQGLLRGDVVAICSQNQLDVAVACFAALYLGAAVTFWDDGLNTRDLQHLLNLMKPKMVFVSNKSITAVAEAVQEASIDSKIINFDQLAGFPEFQSVIAEPKTEEVKNFSCAHIESLDEIALIICTSGTTGLPKGAAVSHGALLRQLHCLTEVIGTGNDWAVFTTISWLSGILYLFLNVALNIKKIVRPVFDEYSICALIEKYKPKVIFLASGMINRLVKFDVLGEYDLSSLTRVIYSGTSLAISSRKAFSKFIPKALITAGYGTTEIGGLFSIQTVNSKPGSCGSIIENAQLKVIDPNTGCKLGPNQRGELLLKTASQMNFYYNNPKATAETVDEEGWFHSGDLGYYDEDGEIFVLERLKDLIKYRGYHIAPLQIEDVILPHPGVKEVAVIGVPHPVDDEHPVAFVVRATNPTGDDEQVTETELVDLVAAELSDSKRLRGGVRFIDHLPKSPSGKVLRKALLDLVMSGSRILGN